MPHAFHTHLGEFHTTRWSIVIAPQGHSPAEVNASVESLYQQYLSPLYAYVRRRGHSPHDAQDRTHEFFSRLLKKAGCLWRSRIAGALFPGGGAV